MEFLLSYVSLYPLFYWKATAGRRAGCWLRCLGHSGGEFDPQVGENEEDRIKDVGWERRKMMILLGKGILGDFQGLEGESFIRSTGKFGQCGRSSPFHSPKHSSRINVANSKNKKYWIYMEIYYI